MEKTAGENDSRAAMLGAMDRPPARDLAPVRSGHYEVFEGLCILACAGICVELGVRLVFVLAPRMAAEPWVLLAEVAVLSVLGMLAADFMTGSTHFLADTVGDRHTPILGPTLISTFRQHHVDPMAMVHHGFIETNGAASLTLLPVLVVVRLLTSASSWPRITGFMVMFSLSCMAVNQVHKWAHAKTAPRFARWLQRRRIILNPGDHARHHRPPHTNYYCILFGWLNVPLDRLGFYTHLTTIIARLSALTMTSRKP